MSPAFATPQGRLFDAEQRLSRQVRKRAGLQRTVVITKRARRQEIVLTRRERWYMHNGKQVRDKPYFKEIRFRVIEDPSIALLAVKNGEIDEMLLTAEQWMTQTGDDDFYRLNTKASGVEWTFFAFQWNTKTPFFSDVRVRKAMSYAFYRLSAGEAGPEAIQF